MKDDIYGTFRKKDADSTYDAANKRIPKEDWASGYWENLPDSNGSPTLIRDTEHLKEECDKRGVLAKGLLKPKSQGKGWEMRKTSSKYFFLG